MEEEYVPQSQQLIEQAQPQAMPSQNEMFLKLMNDELNRDPQVTPQQREELTNELMNKKSEFANGNKNDQANIQQETIEKSQMLTVPEEFKKKIAETLTDTNGFGHNPIEKLGPMANNIANIINGTSQPIFKEKVPGYEMEDGKWMSMEEITDMLSGMKLDQASKEGMKVLLDDTVRKAEAVQDGDDPTFNYQKEFNNIKQKIVETGNLESLMVDKIFGNRTFKDDLMSAIQKGTYADMGIPEAQVQDPTPEDGRITSEDAKIIYGTITQDKDMLKDYLAEYYTKALEQNHNNNLSPAIRRNMQMNQTKPQTVDPVDQVTPQALQGGKLDENRVFVPKNPPII